MRVRVILDNVLFPGGAITDQLSVSAFIFTMSRDFSKAFYNSKEWKETRAYILKRDMYLCVKCGAPAEEVHHKEHISEDNIGDVSITLSADNLISLCRECHFAEHRGEHAGGRKAQEENEYTFDENGFLVPKSSLPPV